jgi:hypothetical protein
MDALVTIPTSPDHQLARRATRPKGRIFWREFRHQSGHALSLFVKIDDVLVIGQRNKKSKPKGDVRWRMGDAQRPVADGRRDDRRSNHRYRHVCA